MLPTNQTSTSLQAPPQPAPPLPTPVTPKAPPRCLQVLDTVPLTINMPMNPDLRRLAPRPIKTDLTTTHFGGKPVPAEIQGLVYNHFNFNSDSEICLQLSYTPHQTSATRQIDEIRRLSPDRDPTSSITHVPLAIPFFNNLTSWQHYLTTLMPLQQVDSRRSADRQRTNYSRQLTNVCNDPEKLRLQVMPEAVTKLFHYDPHQPFLYTILQTLDYMAQFPLETDRRMSTDELTKFFHEFIPDLTKLAKLPLPRYGTIWPSSLLLLVMGQFGLAYFNALKEYLTPAEWLDVYRMATAYYDRHFMDKHQHFPFPTLQ